jgi:hypothetical protein
MGSLSLSFYAAAEGVVYRVETSDDLEFWTDDGVELLDPGPDDQRTACVASAGQQQFIRLAVHLPAP